ncbi:hypothetical protein P4T04_05375 [Bacillus badius]|nr:hypothetical protein [Bacillus badius]
MKRIVEVKETSNINELNSLIKEGSWELYRVEFQHNKWLFLLVRRG